MNASDIDISGLIAPRSVALVGASDQAERFGTNRHNPYPVPGRLSQIQDVLPAYDCTNTSGRPTADTPPPCVVQDPPTFRGRSTAFPRIHADR